MKKIKFDIQFFGSADDGSWDPAQQEALINGVDGGLQIIDDGLEKCATEIKALTEIVSGEEFVNMGNTMIESFTKFKVDAQEYVESIGMWMFEHGANLNATVGHIAGTRMSLDMIPNAQNLSMEFKNDPSFKGVKSHSEADQHLTQLGAAVLSITPGFNRVLAAVSQNPKAYSGTVIDSLESVVRSQNAQATKSLSSFNTEFVSFVKSIKEAIKEAEARARADLGQ